MRKPGSNTLDTEYTYKRNALAWTNMACRIRSGRARNPQPGAPGLVFETWETSNLNQPVSPSRKCSVPHPFDFFLSIGWATTTLDQPFPANSPPQPAPTGCRMEGARYPCSAR